MSKPSVIIVPGAWQTAPAFDTIVALLNEAGYPTVHVPLPTVGGTELPLAGLEDDVEAVRKVLDPLLDAGKKVILIGHSAGGIIMSQAIQNRTAGIERLIFLAAFVLPTGQSLLGMLGGNPLPWMVVDGDRVSGNPDMLPQVGFSDLSPEDQAKWAKGMTHTSARLFATPASYEPWTDGVPCSYIFTARDGALPLPAQQGMVQLLGPNAKTATLDSGHCPFLSMPAELVKAIESVL